MAIHFSPSVIEWPYNLCHLIVWPIPSYQTKGAPQPWLLLRLPCAARGKQRTNEKHTGHARAYPPSKGLNIIVWIAHADREKLTASITMHHAVHSLPACHLASCLRKPAFLATPNAAAAASSPVASKAGRLPSSAALGMQPAAHSRRIRVGQIRASAASREAAALAPITIYAVDGRPVQFQELWDQNEGMAVVAFLRHFGCIFCWEFAASLRDAKAKFDAAGVNLIVIGVGTPDKAKILAERMNFPKDCLYADPNRKAYNSLGLYYGLSRTFFNPASAQVLGRMFSIQKSLKGYTISATPDDPSSVLQQGGLYVFKGKELAYFRKDEGTGDHAPLDDVLKVCCPAIPA